MKITVTQEHINSGIRGSPIALAIKEQAVKKLEFLGVSAFLIVINGMSYGPPKFIRDYDKGLPVTPFEFEL